MKNKRWLDDRLRLLLIAIKDAETFLQLAKEQSKYDRDFGDPAFHLADARSELSNASNAIDEAMGLIDELLAPVPTL